MARCVFALQIVIDICRSRNGYSAWLSASTDLAVRDTVGAATAGINSLALMRRLGRHVFACGRLLGEHACYGLGDGVELPASSPDFGEAVHGAEEAADLGFAGWTLGRAVRGRVPRRRGRYWCSAPGCAYRRVPGQRGATEASAVVPAVYSCSLVSSEAAIRRHAAKIPAAIRTHGPVADARRLMPSTMPLPPGRIGSL